MSRPESDIADPDPGRWRRRARTVPSMLVATVVALGAAPVVLPALAVVDLARGRRRQPLVRSARFALRYLVNDSAEVLLAPMLWVGSRLHPGAGTERYRRVQAWSIRTLADAADRRLGIRVDPDAGTPAEPGSGPLIVLTRHASLLDAGLPSLLFGLDSDWQVRGVVMREALVDPGFDLLYRRLGSVFIDRDDGPAARNALAVLSGATGADDVVTIYPEGRLFRPQILDRSLERLTERDPARAERLAGLRHVLPPRPGGVLALLDALPEADVVVIGHAGFEAAGSVAEVVRRVPLDVTVEVMSRRFARAAIPTDRDERIRWLDERWLDLDAWIHDRVDGHLDEFDARPNPAGEATP